MAWYLDTIRIFVTDETENAKQIIARLQPLGGGTVHHIFGYEDDVYKLTSYVVGSGEKDILKSYAKDGDEHNLTTPFDGIFPVLVNNVQVKMINTICQTLDSTKDETEPVYIVELELLEP